MKPHQEHVGERAGSTAPLPSLLEISRLHCTLGSRHVLRGLSCQAMHSGEVVAVIGPNGAGKSTLLRCISGFLPCQAERLKVGDTDLRRLKTAQRAALIRYLPQASPGFLHLTVHECLQVALHAQKLPADISGAQRLDEVAAALGLQELLARPVDELSGGQKQLVWLAQALLHQPRVLLLDEPLAALDPNHQHHVMRLLRRLARDQALLVLVVLHDLNMAARYADQVLVLREGNVISQGTPPEALTPAVLAEAFQVEARIETCPRGVPLIVIDELLTP